MYYKISWSYQRANGAVESGSRCTTLERTAQIRFGELCRAIERDGIAVASVVLADSDENVIASYIIGK